MLKLQRGVTDNDPWENQTKMCTWDKILIFFFYLEPEMKCNFLIASSVADSIA